MAFLATLRQHLKDKSELQLRIKREAGQLSVVVIPKLGDADPDTTDETIAQFHAALARPFHMVIPDTEDPDQALAAVLASVVQTQGDTLSELERYQQEVEATRTAAREAATKKQQEAAAKKPAAKTPEKAKPATTDKPAKPEKPDKPVAAAKPAASANAPSPPVPAQISDLFGAFSAPVAESPPEASVGPTTVDEA
jgi:hypothetical protein